MIIYRSVTASIKSFPKNCGFQQASKRYINRVIWLANKKCCTLSQACTYQAALFIFQNDEAPLNSDDDISDANSDDGGGDFETEDTIVCQWEKVRQHSHAQMFLSLLLLF